MTDSDCRCCNENDTCVHEFVSGSCEKNKYEEDKALAKEDKKKIKDAKKFFEELNKRVTWLDESEQVAQAINTLLYYEEA